MTVLSTSGRRNGGTLTPSSSIVDAVRTMFSVYWTVG
jgi:hypothetical protein